MTATFAPSHWPLPAGALRGGSNILARALPLGGAWAWQWQLQRSADVGSRRLLALCVALGAAALVSALLPHPGGATLALGLAGLELAALGLARWLHVRHADDGDILTLVGRTLQVEQRRGTQVERVAFDADWLAVEPAAGQGSLVELSGQGRRVRVGRFLPPELRAAFARELRLLLRRATPPQSSSDTN